MAEKKQRVTGPQLITQVLEAAGRPLHVSVIADRVLTADRKRPKAQRSYKGKTPAATISAALTISHTSGKGPFVKTEPGVFALRSWPAATKRKKARPGDERPAKREPKANGQAAAEARVREHTTVVKEPEPAAA